LHESAGRNDAGDRPLANSSRSVTAMDSERPTSIATSRPRSSKVGSEPPESELIVTPSAGSPASR